MIVKRAVRNREIQEWRKAWDAWINDPAQANLLVRRPGPLTGVLIECPERQTFGH